MPDSKAGSFAVISGNEVINAARTLAYIRNFGLPITISEDCWCPELNDLLGDCPAPTGSTFGTPGYMYPSSNPTLDSSVKSDPAPWYDSSIPESGDFLGFLPTDFEGLGSTYQRNTFQTINGGSILGKLRAGERTLLWKGWLFGRTCCAVEYGMQWLTSILSNASGCDGCEGAELDIMLCCPETTGTASTSRSCGQGNPLMPDIGTMANDDAFRTFYNVGLADGPKRLSDRTIGCASCEQEGGGCMKEVEFSLVAGNPFMHKKPVQVCSKNFPSCGVCPGDADQTFWRKILTTTYPASSTDALKCDALLDCLVSPADCITDPHCPTPVLPTIPAFEDPCGCDPYNTSKFCCEISNDIYGQFFEGVPQISVYSGDEDLHNVIVKFYENPQERDCTDQSLFDICNLCDTVNIRFVPKHSTLKIDGLTRRIDIECPGNNVNSAESLVTSTFSWPIFKCVSYIATVEADCNWGIASNAAVTLCVIPREM